MSINLYQTGVSALLSSQQQLATTGHNIANVNTEGYNRQRTEQGAAIGTSSGGNFIGSGTYVQDITRIYNQFSYKEQLLSQSQLGNAKSISLDLNQLNQLMSSSGAAIGGSIDNFYKAVNGIADNPSDIGLRNIALGQAEVLANDVNSLHYNIEQLEKSTNGEIEQIAQKISQISRELANINEQVQKYTSSSEVGQPNDLLDKRDQLITDLGEYVSVSTIQNANGAMTVMIGGSTMLVSGTSALAVQVKAGDPDATKTELQMVSKSGEVSLDGSKLGGKLAAKFEYRDEHLSKAHTELNRLAMAVSQTVNQAQSQGLDLNGKQGLDIFSDINTPALESARVLTPSSNSGNLSARVTITDVTLLPTDEFTVTYDGADYIMTNKNDGTTSNLGPAGAGTYTTAFGFEFKETIGTANTGDSFDIKPTENAAVSMNVTLSDPKSIAASSAIGVVANDNNVSNGSVNIINVNDPEIARSFTEGINAELTVDVYESAPGTFDYRIYNAATPPPAPTLATGSFAAGSSAVIGMPPAANPPAFEIEIGGLPIGQGTLAREKFTISDAFGSGNAGNATFMAATQEQKVIGGGKQTFSQTLATATAEVGSNASSSALVADTAQALFTQAFNRNQSTSGVNLDEEAANMLKYQQAYQAASQIITVANTIFDTILSAVR
jgi:flagellar hook-associated protein 1 FlgK